MRVESTQVEGGLVVGKIGVVVVVGGLGVVVGVVVGGLGVVVGVEVGGFGVVVGGVVVGGLGVVVGFWHTVKLQGMVETVVLKMVRVVVFSWELVVQMLEVVLVTTLVMRRYSAS